MSEIEKNITTLLELEEYKNHLNQVLRVSTSKIYFLKKKFASGPVIMEYPLSECTGIEVKTEKPILKKVFGVLLIVLLIAISYGIYYYWDSFEPGTRFKVGLLALAFGYGVSWAVSGQRYRAIFTMKNGENLIWLSSSGSFKNKETNVNKLINFAKEKGIYDSHNAT